MCYHLVWLLFFKLCNYIIFSCCGPLLYQLVRDFRACTSCNCLLLPVFFHCVRAHSTGRQSYDSVCLELYPLFACDLHHVPIISTSAMPPVVSNSPRRLVKFTTDANSSISTLPSDGSIFSTLGEKLVRGPIFNNSPFIFPRDSKNNSVVFKNLSWLASFLSTRLD